jgi:hypothetical protein
MALDCPDMTAVFASVAATVGMIAMTPGARLDLWRALPPAELAAQLRATSPQDLLTLGREGVRRLGTYRARLVKQERVSGKILPAQTLDLMAQPAPRALRLEYVEGPSAGRKVVWTEKRPKQMRVREGGILGVTSLWLDVGGRLAQGDTNHKVFELGFAPVLQIIANDLAKGLPYGGHQRHDEGFDAAGNYCMIFTAPVGAPGLYAQQTRLCVDPKLAVPVDVEVNDGAGFRERYRYTQIRGNQTADPRLFEDL